MEIEALKNFILKKSFILEAYNVFKKETSWLRHIGLESFCFLVEKEPYLLKELLMCYGTNEPREALKIVAALKPSTSFLNVFERASSTQKRTFDDIEIVITPNDCRTVIDTLSFNGLENVSKVLTVSAVCQVLHFQPWILAEIQNNNFNTHQQALAFTDWCLECLLNGKAEGKESNEIIYLLEEEVKDKYNNLTLIK